MLLTVCLTRTRMCSHMSDWPYICTVYDGEIGGFRTKSAVCILYVYGSGQPCTCVLFHSHTAPQAVGDTPTWPCVEAC